MKHSQKVGGYTIVEVMIFLVITGVLLVSGLAVFNGRQQRTQFTQGVRELDAQLRTIINETASGFYPNNGQIKCTSTNGNGPQITAAAAKQGENAGCTFLGRMLQFTTGNTYTAYTVAGQQYGADGKEVTTLGPGQNSARQTLIAQTPSQPDVPTVADSFVLPWGITVTRVATPGAASVETGAVGFVSTLGAYSGSNLVSGTTGVGVVTLANTNRSTSLDSLVLATKAMTDAARSSGQVILCLRSGGGDRQAAIIIGGNNSNTGTEVMIDTVPPGCGNA